MQFNDEDLEAAVAAGAVDAESAAGFRVFVERRRAAPAADEESFRLLTGFNDIFVSIALLMSLVALGWLAGQVHESFAGLAVAVVSWPLAEFFTRARRMALPSLLLLFAFVGGAAAFATAALPPEVRQAHPSEVFVGAGAAAALAALLHWRRFHVPVTVAAGVLAVGGAAVAALGGYFQSQTVTLLAILAAGLLAFGLALLWDMSDPTRKTRRADVAFWLHLLAAPAIVHSAFALLGVADLSSLDPGRPGQALEPPLDLYTLFSAGLSAAVYALLAVVALVVDRRALMVSGLLYLLYAMNTALRATGALTLSLAISALIIGAALLLLSAFWGAARRGVLGFVPPLWRARLPAAG